MITKFAFRAIQLQKWKAFSYSQAGQIIRDSDRLSQS
jgi:phage gpG-like protein